MPTALSLASGRGDGECGRAMPSSKTERKARAVGGEEPEEEEACHILHREPAQLAVADAPPLTERHEEVSNSPYTIQVIQ